MKSDLIKNQFLFTGVDHSGNTYQECAEKVECTEVNYGGYSAATSLGFIRIAFCIVKTMQHYSMPVLASGCPTKNKKRMYWLKRSDYL